MSMLTVEGFEVVIVPGTRLQYVPHGDFARAFDGTQRSDVRALHRGGHISGTYLSTTNDAPALVAILNSPGPLLFGGTLIGDDAYFHVRNVETVPITSDLLQISFDCMETDEAPSPLLFSFDADAPGTYTFTRSSTGPYIDEDGVLQRAGGNRARFEWYDLDDDGEYETVAYLPGTQRINLVSSDNFDSGWTSVNTPVVTTGIDDPAGGTAAYRIEDDDGALGEVKRLTVAFTGDGIKTGSFTVREATKGANDQILSLFDDSAVAARLVLAISAWTDGEPTVTATTGTYLGKRELGNGYWALFWRSTSVTAANTNRLYVSPGQTGTGSIDIYRANAFNVDTYPSWSVLDAGETIADETLFATFAHAPQEMTVYLKIIEAGWVNVDGSRLLHIGSASASADPRVTIHTHTPGSSAFYAITYDNGTTQDDAILTTAPTMNDVVELRAVLRSGSLEIGQSINSGTETVATDSTTPELEATWAAESGETRIYVGSGGTTNRSMNPIISVRIVQGERTMAEMRHWAKARLHARVTPDVIPPLSVSRTVSVAASASVSVALTVA